MDEAVKELCFHLRDAATTRHRFHLAEAKKNQTVMHLGGPDVRFEECRAGACQMARSILAKYEEG